jgi:hypothetical protein
MAMSKIRPAARRTSWLGTATLIAALALGVIVQLQASRAEGVLVYGQAPYPGWASGTAWNYSNSADAEAVALKNCRSRGANCRVLASVQDTCAALAVQDGGNAYGWVLNRDPNMARQQALTTCAKYGHSCSIKASFCDGPQGSPPLVTNATPTPAAPVNTGGLSACQRFPNLC